MNGETVSVTIGNAHLHVPVYIDRATTLKLAEKVNEKLREIEGQSKRIDTQAFALEAALHFAAALDSQERSHHEETKELLIALDRLNTTIQQLLATYQEGD